MNQKMLLGFIIALLSLSIFVSAVPAGPKSLDRSNEERWPIWAPLSTTAIAGNLTELTLNGSTVTRTWQGYYGNISGMIVLGDTNNISLYDWTLSNPQGEIFAVRNDTVPSWNTVTCASYAELQSEDWRLGVNASIDEDSVNNTFVDGGAPDQVARNPGNPHFVHPTIWVANQTIDADTCPLAVMYNSTGQPSPYFKEIVLSDNVNVPAVPGDQVNGLGGFVIYTAIIAHTLNPWFESDGFNNLNHDFEMIVGENGHGAEDGATATVSTYWFYVELD